MKWGLVVWYTIRLISLISRMKRFFHGVATLCGLIVGVGMFGVPFVAARAGLGVGMFWIGLLGSVILLLHLFYGEVISATPGKHRLPGYVGHFFGKKWKRVVMVIDVLRFWGLQIAYMIVGGTFLSLLFHDAFGGTPRFYSIILFFIVAVITYFGLRLVDRIEFAMTWILLGAFLLIIVRAFGHFNPAHIVAATGQGFFLPYGVVMVSLAGAAAIPEVWDIVGRRKKIFRASIIVGTIIPIILTAFFALAVVGASGSATSQEAISGLRNIFGSGILMIGAGVGALSIATSYIVIALYLQEALRYDFLVKHTPAWLFAVGVPFVLFVSGVQSFVNIIDIIGAVFFGLEGILIVALALAVAKRRRLHITFLTRAAGVLVALLLLFGVMHKLITLG